MNQFITDNLTEEEIELILVRFAELKRQRFGGIEAWVEEGKMIRFNRIYSENPATFRTIYSTH